MSDDDDARIKCLTNAHDRYIPGHVSRIVGARTELGRNHHLDHQYLAPLNSAAKLGKFNTYYPLHFYGQQAQD